MKYKGIKSLTTEQQDEICAIIGDWHLNWKHGLINWDERTHRLGYAKEKLKEMICGVPDIQQQPVSCCSVHAGGYEECRIECDDEKNEKAIFYDCSTNIREIEKYLTDSIAEQKQALQHTCALHDYVLKILEKPINLNNVKRRTSLHDGCY